MPFPSPRDFPDPGIKPVSLCLLHWQVGLYWSWLEKFRLDILKVTFLGGVEPEVKYWFAAMGANVTIWHLLFLLNTPENMHAFSPG